MLDIEKTKDSTEKGFTLLETVMALGLIAVFTLEVIGVRGHAINFNEYDRKSSQALWLAKSVMSKIEWGASFYDFKEMNLSVKGADFDEILCSKDPALDCDFTYDADVSEWKFDFVSLLTKSMFGGGGDEEGEGDGQANPFSALIEDQIKNIFGGELFKVASVTVYWPEGAKRNSVELAMLVVNQLPLDQFIETMPVKEVKDEKDADKQQAKKVPEENKPSTPQQNNPNSGDE